MINFVIVVILIVVVGSAMRYLIKERKKGVTCVGCPGGCPGCSGAADMKAGCGCGGSEISSCGHSGNENTK